MTQIVRRPVSFKKRIGTSGTLRASAERSLAVKVSDLQPLIDGWLLDLQYRMASPATIANRVGFMGRFMWWVKINGFESVDTLQVRQFMAYIGSSGGVRWGNDSPGKVRDLSVKPIRATTIETYHRNLLAFFNWCLAEGLIAASPMARVARPDMRSRGQIQPFSTQQLESLLETARSGQFPERDTAIIMCLVDTGVRAAECCSIKIGEVDKTNKCVEVVGKGGKPRTVRFGKETSMSLWRYLRTRNDGADAAAPLFPAHAGNHSGSALTPDGLGTLIARLGRAAGIKGVRCSPHTLRHTFAVNFLRNGGNSFALQQLLGHTDMKMTQRYVMIAQSDLAAQHVIASPMDNLRKRRK